MNRSKAALLNSSVAVFAQMAMILTQFISRTFFIKILGDQFLGMNGLFVNILNILNLAELGIGSAITFSLYRPLVEGKKREIAAIMHLLKRWYRIIAGIVAIAGLILMPFVPQLIHHSQFSSGSIMFYFFIALMGTMSTYLLSYKRTLIIADQMGYINTINTVGYNVIMQVCQTISLFLFKDFGIYLFLQLFFNLISNIAISRKVDNYYPYLEETNDAVSQDVMDYFKKNVKGMISAKMGGIVVNGTDNLILSTFLGLTTVGLYSNYTLITNGLTSVLTQGVSAVSSSIGNLAASADGNKQLTVVRKYFAITVVLSFIMSIGFATFSHSFVAIWIGKNYILDNFTTFIISFNFFIQSVRQSLIGISNSYGLYWQQRFKPIFEAVLNLIVSIILVKYTGLGISGVLIGTICSNLFVNFWWEPLVVFRYGIHASVGPFLFNYGLVVFFSAILIAIGVLAGAVTTNIFIGLFITVCYIFVCTLLSFFYLRLNGITIKSLLSRFHK